MKHMITVDYIKFSFCWYIIYVLVIYNYFAWNKELLFVQERHLTPKTSTCTILKTESPNLNINNSLTQTSEVNQVDIIHIDR